MKRVLVYDTSVRGHHLEYLHHIYMATDGVKAEFIFALPEEFHLMKKHMQWPIRENVSFDYIRDKEIKGVYIKERWQRAKLAAKYIKKNNVDEVFFIELVVHFPFLPLFVSRNVKVSGILYRLVPYEWKRLSLLTKIKDIIEVFTLGKSSIVKAPMCLNDNSCACFYNKRLGVSKFIQIVDPINTTNYHPKSIRDEIGATINDRVILHFGGMSERKGTLTVLEAISLMDESQLRDKVFVFAGPVYPEITERFGEYIHWLSKKAHVVVYEGFLPFDYLLDLCFSCDCIVIPYRNASYSSGVIGHASQFQKTVIGPDDGLLGKLIKRNKLGIGMKENNAATLAKELSSEQAYLPRPNNYLQKESVEAFSTTIINALMDY